MDISLASSMAVESRGSTPEFSSVLPEEHHPCGCPERYQPSDSKSKVLSQGRRNCTRRYFILTERILVPGSSDAELPRSSPSDNCIGLSLPIRVKGPSLSPSSLRSNSRSL